MRQAGRWLLLIVGLGCLVWLWWNNRPGPAPSTDPSPEAGPVSPGVEHSAVGQTADAAVGAHELAEAVEEVGPSVLPAPVASATGRRSPRTILEVQLALERQAISPGPLDGIFGPQTRSAVRAFQQRNGLSASGEIDGPTRSRLVLEEPSEETYRVRAEDLVRLQPVGKSWLEKSQQDRLEYETILELAAEMGHARQGLIRSLNPGVDWEQIQEGTELRIPRVTYPPVHRKAALVKIFLGENLLQAFDSKGDLLGHFPCSIARRVEKRPVGELVVVKVAADPNYRFDPGLFPESPEGRRLGRPLIIPPGPNNPVGTAWIGLSLAGYGIHGTPNPETIGRSESHGCFRLANWSARLLAEMVGHGTPVVVEP